MLLLLAESNEAGRWDWTAARESLPVLMEGLVTTIEAVFGGMLVALTVGLVWAMMRRARNRWLSYPATGLVEFVRSTPLLIQLFFLFYVLRPIANDFLLQPLGIGDMPKFTVGMLALGLHYSTYTSEVYRAGIDGVPRGQWEAAKALNLNMRQTYLHVILPQAIPPVIPALGNYLIAMFKDAPLLMAIGVVEVLNSAYTEASTMARYLEPITIVGVMYLILSLLSGSLVTYLEKRLHVKRA